MPWIEFIITAITPFLAGFFTKDTYDRLGYKKEMKI